MPIDIQLKSLLFSLFYGVLFSLLLRLNYKYMYNGNIIFNFLINVIFVVDNVLLYFIILKRLNDGVIHSYFFIMILIGFFIMEFIFKKNWFDFKYKKWYNPIIGWLNG